MILNRLFSESDLFSKNMIKKSLMFRSGIALIYLKIISEKER